MRVLPRTSEVIGGRLHVGGCDTVALADAYGSPLYVYDEAGLQAECEEFAAAFAGLPSGSRGMYALKAFPCVAAARIAYGAGLGLLCASAGEVAVARAAGVPSEAIVLHGNNKSADDLRSGAGRIAVDSHDEIDRIERLGIRGDCWLRVAPGLEAGGHGFLRTGALDSKFGVGISDALGAAKRVASIGGVRLRGIHAHIGSHWFGATEQVALVEVIVPFVREVSEAIGEPITEVDLGGGFAVAYTDDDPPVTTPAQAVRAVADAGWPDDLALHLEPGRALVGRAGISLHRIGTVKHVPGVRTYAAVDGGMSDNIRHPLYGARFHYLLANRAGEKPAGEVRLVGKHCETGDVLGDALLPEPCPDDVLVTCTTGAYCYAMSSNYNQIGRPAVVFVRDGTARVVIRRETTDDLLRCQSG